MKLSSPFDPPYQLNECVHALPTVGFNVEHVQYKKIDMTVWDVGGQDKIRRLWNHYYRGTDALIFVVDSTDRARIEEARSELHKILSNDEVQQTNSAVLVFANKQDLPHAIPPTEMIEKLALRSVPCMNWYCQGSVASTGAGLYEGLDWLNNVLTKTQKGRQGGASAQLRF